MEKILLATPCKNPLLPSPWKNASDARDYSAHFPRCSISEKTTTGLDFAHWRTKSNVQQTNTSAQCRTCEQYTVWNLYTARLMHRQRRSFHGEKVGIKICLRRDCSWPKTKSLAGNGII